MRAFLDTYTSTLDRAIRTTSIGVDVIPTDVRLNLANGELTLAMHGEFVLQKLLRSVAPNYDFVLLDTLPYLGILVVNTLVAAQEVIIPMEAEYFATQSVGLMIEQVQLMWRSELNPGLRVTGILLTMVDVPFQRQIPMLVRAKRPAREEDHGTYRTTRETTRDVQT